MMVIYMHVPIKEAPYGRNWLKYMAMANQLIEPKHPSLGFSMDIHVN
jgi:hypothetical protein